MARGAPDFSNVKSAGVTSRFLDLAELAARLGSPASFYRDGEVVWMDDFSQGLQNWGADPSGTGSSVTLSPALSIHGGYSAKLVTGDETDDYSQITTQLPYPYLAKTGVEFSFVLNVDLAKIELNVSFFDGTYWHNPVVRYLPPTQALTIVDENEAEQSLGTGLRLYAGSVLFHTLKVVFDPVNSKYTRLHLNARSYDISAYSYYKPTPYLWRYLQLAIKTTTSKDDNEASYIDRVIVTSYPS